MIWVQLCFRELRKSLETQQWFRSGYFVLINTKTFVSRGQKFDQTANGVCLFTTSETQFKMEVLQVWL